VTIQAYQYDHINRKSVLKELKETYKVLLRVVIEELISG